MTDDDRISCFDCSDLGRCKAPFRAHPDLPRRCEFFAPKRGVSDQRIGRERFPTLWAEYQESRAATARAGIAKAKAAAAAR